MTSRVSMLFGTLYSPSSGFHDIYTPPSGKIGVLKDFSVNHNASGSARAVVWFSSNAHVTTYNLLDVTGGGPSDVYHWVGYEVFDHTTTLGLYVSGSVWSIVASGYEITP